jgi:enamine deaminase RidA (YjgF/YER057c/UK114 family)
MDMARCGTMGNCTFLASAVLTGISPTQADDIRHSTIQACQARVYDDALVTCWSFRYISGMVGIVDTEGNLLENEEDMGDQTTNALARVGRILAQYGATPLSILASVSHATVATPVSVSVECCSGLITLSLATDERQTLYVTDMAKKPAMNAAWAEWFDSHAVPARATIEIDSLGHRRLIEVCAIAAIVDSSRL